MNIKTKIKLNNGVEMPIFGLGVYRAPSGEETQNAVRYALEAGYRHIDTAKIYGNERDVGIAVHNSFSGIPRDEIFITTKLWNSDHGYDSTITACNESLKKLGLKYLDLYLVHWPVETLRGETWKAMEYLLEEGKCRAIGVSNYMIHHLKELLETAKIVPAVNQVEFSPYLFRKDLLEFCRSQGIQFESYSPLTKGRKLKDPKLVSLGSKYSKTPAQILIRWALEHQIVVIPKSTNEGRIYENANVFDFHILEEDMNLLNSFDEGLVTGWDPTNAP
ncbi:MAG: aldo/keto reductase [Candidatus Hermodarchaeota archaeon]